MDRNVEPRVTQHRSSDASSPLKLGYAREQAMSRIRIAAARANPTYTYPSTGASKLHVELFQLGGLGLGIGHPFHHG